MIEASVQSHSHVYFIPRHVTQSIFNQKYQRNTTLPMRKLRIIYEIILILK